MIFTTIVNTYILMLKNVDHEYTWIIWTGKPDVWLSAYNQLH